MRISLDRIAYPFVVFSERFYPDPFVFAIGLTGLTFAMALGLTPTSPSEALTIWGQGLTGLLPFMTQVCLTLVFGHALAHTAIASWVIEAIAGLPRRSEQAYALVVVVAGFASLIAGALGLVVGGLTAIAVAQKGKASGLRIHFPLLVAGAYAGFLVWHMGYSSAAALFVATPGHSLEAAVGIVPVTETIFASWNIALALVALGVTAIVCSLLAPESDAVVELDDSDRNDPEAPTSPAGPSSPDPSSFGRRLEEARILSVGMGLLLLVYLASWFWLRGFQLTLDIVNWSFLGVGLLLARSPRHYAALILNASRTLGPILLQYPFYAGVMALMTGTEIVDLCSDAFVAISTPRTLGFWAFMSGGMLNFFVPSGGGQWAVQGPIFVAAAQKLGVEIPVVVMGVAYGDQWTNMIQPFWALPLLAIVRLNARAIMGYCFVVLLAAFCVFSAGLLWLGAG